MVMQGIKLVRLVMLGLRILVLIGIIMMMPELRLGIIIMLMVGIMLSGMRRLGLLVLMLGMLILLFMLQ